MTKNEYADSLNILASKLDKVCPTAAISMRAEANRVRFGETAPMQQIQVSPREWWIDPETHKVFQSWEDLKFAVRVREVIE